jgi:hypothetical protein
MWAREGYHFAIVFDATAGKPRNAGTGATFHINTSVSYSASSVGGMVFPGRKNLSVI